MWCDRGNLIVENPAKESCCFCTQIFVYEYFDAKIATFWITSALWTQLGKSNFHCCWSCGREYMYICIGVYMNTHSKTVKCRKRDSLKPFFWKNRSKNNFFETFSLLRKKTSLSLYTFASSKQGSMGDGLNQHTANVPDRKVPKVRNRLQRVHKPSLLGLCRASGDSQRNPSASALWLVSSVGSEHDATNVGVGSSSLSRVTILEVWQSWSIAPVLKTGRRQRLKGSNPLASANLPYRITVVRQILDLQVVVRFHLGQHQ